MKGFRKFLVVSTMIAGFLLAGTAAKADPLTITLSSPFQVGVSGDVIGFTATVTNTTGGTVQLAGDSFNVDIPWPTAVGLYPGAFEITGGGDDNAEDELGVADFNVYVTPEPSSLLLMGTGLLGLALLGASLRRVTA